MIMVVRRIVHFTGWSNLLSTRGRIYQFVHRRLPDCKGETHKMSSLYFRIQVFSERVLVWIVKINIIGFCSVGCTSSCPFICLHMLLYDKVLFFSYLITIFCLTYFEFIHTTHFLQSGSFYIYDILR